MFIYRGLKATSVSTYVPSSSNNNNKKINDNTNTHDNNYNNNEINNNFNQNNINYNMNKNKDSNDNSHTDQSKNSNNQKIVMFWEKTVAVGPPPAPRYGHEMIVLPVLTNNNDNHTSQLLSQLLTKDMKIAIMGGCTGIYLCMYIYIYRNICKRYSIHFS
jgi:hypothetical protein